MLNIDKSKFNKDQLNMINKCEEEGIDVSVINNPEYSEEQMKYPSGSKRRIRHILL